jgi:hypothetical protein
MLNQTQSFLLLVLRNLLYNLTAGTGKIVALVYLTSICGPAKAWPALVHS